MCRCNPTLLADSPTMRAALDEAFGDHPEDEEASDQGRGAQ